jgi:hypothetical protein
MLDDVSHRVRCHLLLQTRGRERHARCKNATNVSVTAARVCDESKTQVNALQCTHRTKGQQLGTIQATNPYRRPAQEHSNILGGCLR